MGVEKDILEIKTSVARMEGRTGEQLSHIADTLKGLCCGAHTEKIQRLEIDYGRLDGNINNKLIVSSGGIVIVISGLIAILVNTGIIK